jgi:hypothetical protein
MEVNKIRILPIEIEPLVNLEPPRAIESPEPQFVPNDTRASEEAFRGSYLRESLQNPAPSTVPFEGFNFEREQNPRKSAKDAFAQAVRNAPPPPGEDKQALEAWFNRYIRPQMEALGHRINWAKGDKMNFTSSQGTFTVDFLRGAGDANWAVAWQVEEPGGGASGGGGGGMATGVPMMYQAFMRRLAELVSPNASREEMEEAIRQAAEETGVPFEEVYKESIRLPGHGWIDLVQSYGGPDAKWQWMQK